MAEHIVGNAHGGQREAVAEEIPVNTQPCEELTDDELLRLFDCPILGIPNIGVHSVRVDPLLTVGDNIIANSLTNAQNMAGQLQFQEMDNTSHQQQEQKSTKRKHKSKETKSLGLTKLRTTVAKTYRTRSSNIMKFKNDKSSAIELD
nr:hypothetical protein Itr_chr06CG11600 [Ipomoea trifida]